MVVQPVYVTKFLTDTQSHPVIVQDEKQPESEIDFSELFHKELDKLKEEEP